MIVTKTSCRRCGEVRLDRTAFTLFTDASTQIVSYRFECPYCGIAQQRDASARAATLLLTLGAVSPPITEDEIARFVGALDSDWRAHLGS